MPAWNTRADEGNAAETERQVRIWLREAAKDLSELAFQRRLARRAVPA